QLEAVTTVAARDVEDACTRLEAEALDDEVHLALRSFVRKVQRDLVEPFLLEEAVEPVRIDVHTVRTARSSTIPASTDLWPSPGSSAARARAAASSASCRAPSTPCVMTKPSASRMSSTTWNSIPRSSATGHHARCTPY